MNNNALGADWGSIVNSAASVFTSITATKAQQDAYKSQANLMKLQMQSDQQKAEANKKLLQYSLIGGGILVAGILVTVLVSKS